MYIKIIIQRSNKINIHLTNTKYCYYQKFGNGFNENWFPFNCFIIIDSTKYVSYRLMLANLL